MAEIFLNRWDSSSTKTFKDKIRLAANEINEVNASIEVLSIRWNIPTLVLESIIHLDNLNDDSLLLLGKNTPPVSTWFFLAEKSDLEIRQIINDSTTDWNNLLTSSESTKISSVTNLDINPETIFYFSKKTKKYDVLRPKDRSALHSMGTYLKNKGALSIKQTSYLASLLKKIQDHGLFNTNSTDNDQLECQEALQLLDKIL
jgi:hypothetical protein